MVAITSIALTAAAMFGLSAAAPTEPPLTGVVHRITAGSTVANNGLHFEPEIISAIPGDLIEFHFKAKNHSVVQSSFDNPCVPINDGAVFSGFNFKTDAGEAPNVFSFVVKDYQPFWFYCSQPNGDHCQKGMSGVINQNPNPPKTLAAYKEKAKSVPKSQSPSISPLGYNGGRILPNPGNN